ncbi:Eukaryotic translation initiation factor 4 gamma 1, partial [Armadillidium vulgare]
MTDDNGWNTVICSRRTIIIMTMTHQFSVQKFSNWATGSTGGSKNHEEESSRPFINRFAPLELTPMMDMRRSNPMGKLAPGGMNTSHRQGNSFGSKSMPPPSEKEGIHYSKMSSASGDRSKSNSRSSSRQSSRDNSMARETTTTYRDVQKPVQQKPPLDRNMVEKYANGLLEEYYSINDINEAVLCFQEKFKHHVDILKFVEISFEKVFDKTVEKRAKIGNLYNHLIKHKHMSISQFAEGLKPVLEMLSDYVIDIPQVFSYVGGILLLYLRCNTLTSIATGRLLVDNVASLENILTILEPCEKKMDVFAKVIKEASVVLEIQFISEASSSECSVVAGEDIPIDAKLIRIELCKLFKSKVPDEEIFDWIE